MFTDFRATSQRPFLITRGVHALAGFEVPSLPEPFSEEQNQLSRSELFVEHQARFLDEMKRMLRGLHDPVLWRGSPRERFVPLTTYDLRLVNEPNPNGTGRLRLFLLVKAFVQVTGDGEEATVKDAACHRAVAACNLCRAQAPRDLRLNPLTWAAHTDTAKTDPIVNSVGDEELGLDGAFLEIGDIRRENCLSIGRTETEYNKFCGELHEGQFFAGPEPWPESQHDLLPTCKVLAGAAERLVLSVRIQPTVRSQAEYQAIQDYLGQKKGTREEFRKKPRRYRRAVNRIGQNLRHREFFYVAVQVAGSSRSVVSDVMTTFAGEQMVGVEPEPGPSRPTSQSPERPARIHCLNERELEIARFNLANLEFLPWGAVSGKVAAALHPGGGMTAGLPNLQSFVPTDELRLPDTFWRRDMEVKEVFARMRSLFTFRETASVWRIPVVSRIGQTGLIGSLPTPFQQFPLPTVTARPSVSLGHVDQSGFAAEVEYRVPIVVSEGNSGGALCGRTFLVTGSPSTGKTNFVKHLLRQLWSLTANSSSRTPFLAIDPTGGNFRDLNESAGDRLQVVEFGSDRQPFALDVLVVPVAAPLPGYLSRLADAFRVFDEPNGGDVQVRDLLYQSLLSAYRDKVGSDASQSVADVLGTGRASDYPNLDDLTRHITTDISTSLSDPLAKLESIVRPGREPFSAHLDQLFSQPTVIELGGISDPRTRAFALAMLLTYLGEHMQYRAQSIAHVLVVDDFHFLRTTSQPSDPTVRMATDMAQWLSNLAAREQSVVFVDQAPATLLEGTLEANYEIVMHNMNDDLSFQRLVDRLKLNTDQRQFARFGLRSRQAIMLEPYVGLSFVLRLDC